MVWRKIYFRPYMPSHHTATIVSMYMFYLFLALINIAWSAATDSPEFKFAWAIRGGPPRGIIIICGDSELKF